MKKAIATAPGQPTKYVDLTAAEDIARKLEEVQNLAEKPMRDWLEEMADSDQALPRYVEDIIDVLTPVQQAALPLETKTRYDVKKTKRGQRPE